MGPGRHLLLGRDLALITVRRSAYVSNVRGLGKELEADFERIVARAARDAAREVSALSEPTVQAFASEGETKGGTVSARVFVARNDWWAQIFDTGALGKRELPLAQPGRREREWKIRRRGRSYRARRSAEALRSGGIAPQYFFVRAKRYGEQRLADYLRRGV